MQTNKTTLADMRYVLSNLSSQFLNELNRGGFTTTQVRMSMKAFIKDGRALTLSRNNEINAILGYTIRDNVIHTAFPSTPAFFKADSARFGKRLMREIQKNEGNLAIETHSYSDDPKIERWYGLMGFYLKEQTHVFKTFRLNPCTSIR